MSAFSENYMISSKKFQSFQDFNALNLKTCCSFDFILKFVPERWECLKLYTLHNVEQRTVHTPYALSNTFGNGSTF